MIFHTFASVNLGAQRIFTMLYASVHATNFESPNSAASLFGWQIMM